jgi:hypothetical protein
MASRPAAANPRESLLLEKQEKSKEDGAEICICMLYSQHFRQKEDTLFDLHPKFAFPITLTGSAASVDRYLSGSRELLRRHA